MVSTWILTAVTTQLRIVFFCCTNCTSGVCCACAHLSAGLRWWGWSRYVGGSHCIHCLKQLLYVGRMEEWRSRPCWTATGLWHSSVISSIMLSLKIKKEMVRLVLPCHFPPSMCLLCYVFNECSQTLWACALQILFQEKWRKGKLKK